jgi:heme oxygenase (biliverdin-IX-beta and delta-forming)
VITVAQELKQNTSVLHRGVEAHLKLLDPSLSAERLRSVLLRFYGFWAANEPTIGLWCATHPKAASALRWKRRQRTELFADDLLTVGIEPRRRGSVPRPPPVFEHIDHAQVLGWLYVAEGSTLGGAIIDRHFRNTPALAGVSLRCFAPYAEGPGAMWLAFRSSLQDFAAGDAARTTAVVAAAVATFESLDRWLSPLGIGSTG